MEESSAGQPAGTRGDIEDNGNQLLLERFQKTLQSWAPSFLLIDGEMGSRLLEHLAQDHTLTLAEAGLRLRRSDPASGGCLASLFCLSLPEGVGRIKVHLWVCALVEKLNPTPVFLLFCLSVA